MSTIRYNGVAVFSGQPNPLVTRNPEYIYRGDSRRLELADRYTLVGQITGCTYDIITGFQARLNSYFGTDFGNLEFVDVGFTGVVSGCKILNIQYQQGTNVGVLPYNINLIGYPEGFFESIGVVEKRNEWTVNVDEKSNLTITHEIAAKGANTSPGYNNALDNAKNFVLGLTGFNPPSLFPFFINGFSGSLDNRVESINRLTANYSITENYIGRTGSNITEEITANLTSGADGIITVAVNGNFRLGKGGNFNDLRQRYSIFDSFSFATGVYNDYRGGTGLFINPISSGVTDDFKENSLSFNITFADFPAVNFKHVSNVAVVSGLDGIVTTSINGEIQGLGRQKVRYDNAFAFYKTLNIFSVAQQAYTDYVGVGYPFSMNPFPISSGMTIDRFGGRIGYNVAFSDKPLGMTCSGVKKFDYTISKEFPVRVLKFGLVPYGVSGGCVQDLNYNTRAVLAVRGDAVVNQAIQNSDAVVKQFLNNNFRLNYLQQRDNLVLDGVNLSSKPDKNSTSFDYTVSFDEGCPTNPDVDYAFITGISI